MPISAIVEITIVTNPFASMNGKTLRRPKKVLDLSDDFIHQAALPALRTCAHGSDFQARHVGARVQAISNVTLTASVSFFPCSSALTASSSGKACV